jgi:hypothetical protein
MLRGFWTVLATGFTLAVIALSMAMNFSFGYGLGTSAINARILGALSVACDGLKAVLPLFIAWQWADGHRLASVAGAVLFALLLTYGTASAIGFAAENRVALTGARENRNVALDDAIADLATAQAHLAGLPSHRLHAVIEAELAAQRKDRLWDATSSCTDATLPASRDFCKRIEALKGELAVAAKGMSLSEKIERLNFQIAQARQAGAGTEADPQARAIAYFTAIEPVHVRSGLAWLLAMTVEATSAFGLFAVVRRDARHMPSSTLATHMAVTEAGNPWRLAARIAQEHTKPAQGSRLSRAG